jgi:oligopeptide transport system substrate-binding protein
MTKLKPLLFVLIMILLVGCTTDVEPEMSIVEPTLAQELPTDTTEPIPTNTTQPTDTPEPTNTPEPTALPGEVVYPLESLEYGIPWLPYDKTEIPMITYYGFNVTKPPFNIPEVRQAFAAALDTEVLTLIYQRSTFYNAETPASSIIPPQTLSRDVYGEIGISYDPELGKQLLADAGYEDPSNFPEVNVLLAYVEWFEAPGISIQAAEEAVRMWEENLGVKVNLEVVSVPGDIIVERQKLLETGAYDIFEAGVWADENDPHNFVYDMFHPNGYDNLTGFSSGRIAQLIGDGKSEADPAKRLPIYLEIDRILSEEELPIIPIFHCTIDLSQY